MAPRIRVREHAEVSELVAASLRADGVKRLTGHQAVRVEGVNGKRRRVARHQGAEVVVPFNELLYAVGRIRRFKANYRVIPWAAFADPEVARVGLSKSEAKEQGMAHAVAKCGIDDLDRAIADGIAHGFVKVLTVPGKDRILGVAIVDEHAGDLLAMKHGLGLNKILGTIHICPTLAEANKYVAGAWKRAHARLELLQWVGRYRAWERA